MLWVSELEPQAQVIRAERHSDGKPRRMRGSMTQGMNGKLARSTVEGRHDGFLVGEPLTLPHRKWQTPGQGPTAGKHVALAMPDTQPSFGPNPKNSVIVRQRALVSESPVANTNAYANRSLAVATSVALRSRPVCVATVRASRIDCGAAKRVLRTQ